MTMELSVRKATAHDLHPVCALLRGSTLNASRIPLETRKRMFAKVWGGTEDYCGYVLETDRIVGFLGLLFTQRMLEGSPQKFCELHSWYVEEEFRNESMRLLLPVLSMRNTTLLNYTPTQSVYDISLKFGFEDLETKLLLAYPIPSIRSLDFRHSVSSAKHEISAQLSGESKVIFNDHIDIPCMHLLVRRRGTDRTCYLILKTLRRRWFEPFGRVLYVSDRQFFLKALPFLRTYLCARYGWQCLVLTHNEFKDVQIPLTRALPRPIPSLIKSRHLRPEQVKPLYTLPLLIGYRLH